VADHLTTGAEPNRIVVPAGDFVDAAVAHLSRILRAAIDARGEVTVALAGGSTPRPVYAALAQRADLDWVRIEVYFGDERAVPPDDPNSNFRMAKEALLDPAGISERRVHRMEAERPDLQQAADDYAAALPDALDVMILGIGHDGHTASLFPGSPALDERRRLVVPVTGPTEPRTRLTVTPPVIARAGDVIVLATGSAKAGPVARALNPGARTSDVPATLARRGTWILDEAAAAVDV
jgi:6-phosphogluconolactonase